MTGNPFHDATQTSTVLAVIAASIMLAVFATAGIMSAWRAVPVATTTRGTVATFNDGYAASKQDDCQQGFQAACAWIAGRP